MNLHLSPDPNDEFCRRLLGVLIFVGIVYAVAFGLFIAGPPISPFID